MPSNQSSCANPTTVALRGPSPADGIHRGGDPGGLTLPDGWEWERYDRDDSHSWAARLGGACGPASAYVTVWPEEARWQAGVRIEVADDGDERAELSIVAHGDSADQAVALVWAGLYRAELPGTSHGDIRVVFAALRAEASR